MEFFSVSLSGDKKRLIYHMNYFFRGTLIFILLSLLGSFLFSFKPNDWNEISLIGKTVMFLFLALIFIGTVYKHTIIFNHSNQRILIQKGLVFFYKENSFSFDDLERVIYSAAHSPSFKFVPKTFGFVIKDTSIILSRSRSQTPSRFYQEFKLFYPRHFNQ